MTGNTQVDPILKQAKVKGTGLPIDGHELTFAYWAYDNHKAPHLFNWDDEADEAVMRTMHQTDELYKDMPLDEFSKLWKRKEYEPDGAFCLDPNCIEIKMENSTANSNTYDINESVVMQLNSSAAVNITINCPKKRGGGSSK